jgi:hypothetical protein
MIPQRVTETYILSAIRHSESPTRTMTDQHRDYYHCRPIQLSEMSAADQNDPTIGVSTYASLPLFG